MRPGHGLAHSLAARAGVLVVEARLVEQRELAQCERQVLRKAIVHIGRQAAALLLHLRALQTLLQPRGRDTGTDLAAEQGEHGGAHRVDGHRPGRGCGDDAHHVVAAADERQQEPVARRGRERVRAQPPAGSRKTIGMPLANASRQASGS